VSSFLADAMTDAAIYAGLFLSAFLAATILPMQSEAVLVGLLLADYPPWMLITVASVGNVLGAVLNWLLGRWIEHFRSRSWFPVDATKLERAQAWYHRYGKWSLLLSWVPIVGDPLTVIAGVLREPLRYFLPLVAIAKIGRYLVLAAITLSAA
jgi:membrane protein YqaA with SNARE-associated domain